MQAINFKPCTWLVEASVKVKEYETPVALGTPDDIVSERLRIWPRASVLGIISGVSQSNTHVKAAANGIAARRGF